jgi:hypothetical protein
LHLRRRFFAIPRLAFDLRLLFGLITTDVLKDCVNRVDAVRLDDVFRVHKQDPASGITKALIVG